MMDFHAQNEKVLGLLSRYLTFAPRAVSREDVISLARDTGEGYAYAFSVLMAEAMGLDIADDRFDLALFLDYILPMTECLEPEEFRQDAYYRAVRPAPGKHGNWEIRYQAYAPCEAFVAGDMRQLPDGRILPRIGFFMEGFSYLAVLEGGREWMTVTPNEILTMRQPISRARGRVAAYGLGLGYFAFMAAEKECVDSVTVVERDGDAIRLFRENLLPHFPNGEKIQILQGDALEFQKNLSPADYDFVFADIWHDVADGLPLYRELKRHEKPGAEYAYWIEDTLKCYEM